MGWSYVITHMLYFRRLSFFWRPVGILNSPKKTHSGMLECVERHLRPCHMLPHGSFYSNLHGSFHRFQNSEDYVTGFHLNIQGGEGLSHVPAAGDGCAFIPCALPKCVLCATFHSPDVSWLLTGSPVNGPEIDGTVSSVLRDSRSIKEDPST